MTYYPPVPVSHPDVVGCVVRTAAEGVPIAAIARAMKLPYDKVLDYLQRAKRLGALTEIPKPDWPQNQNERRPTTLQTPVSGKSMSPDSAARPAEDVEFLCRHVFRLTNLEAGFLVVLLKCLFAEKEKLHAVIELQRASRPLRPLQSEVTDVKMVDVMICKLRKKMNAIDLAFIIRTSWGKGYFLDQSVKDGIYRMLDVGVADFSSDPTTGGSHAPTQAQAQAKAPSRAQDPRPPSGGRRADASP